MKLRFALCAFLSLNLVSAAMASSTWYVDGVNGNDSNNCQSAQTACKTIQHALSLSVAGDSIVLAPANYLGRLTIDHSLSIVGAAAATTTIGGADIDPLNSAGTSVVNISGVTIQNGDENDYGGGIANHGTLTITNSVITANKAGLCGGGIGNFGVLTMNKSTVSGNSAPGGGGGICCLGQISRPVSMRITNSTISGNDGFQFGGGIDAQGCPTTIINSTISNNQAANGAGNGGGIWAQSGMSIFSTTISGNSAMNGGGIAPAPQREFAITLKNSIVANNVALGSKNGNCGSLGLVTSEGYNLSSDDTCNFNATGDLINTEPKLGPLQNNGGPTDTMPLLCMSPAIDAGNPNGCTDGHGNLLRSDQRGFRRPGDPRLTTGCDIGAYEAQLPK